MVDELWGPIRQVRQVEIPSARNSKFSGLVVDVLLRLERTEAGYALEIPFYDYKELEGAYTALKKVFATMQPAPKLTKFKLEKGGKLFVVPGKQHKPAPVSSERTGRDLIAEIANRPRRGRPPALKNGDDISPEQFEALNRSPEDRRPEDYELLGMLGEPNAV